MESVLNEIHLRGTLGSLPAVSHENHGKQFVRFLLEVPRLSGAVDVLPIVAPESLVQPLKPELGDWLTIHGQIRSHNIRDEQGRHLLIFVFAAQIVPEEGEPINDVTLEALVCRSPVYRRTPMGREICDVMLAVPRAFRRADYLPCILWGRLAQQAAGLTTGSRLHLSGRLQSRPYTKQTESGPEERTAYEVSALTVDFPEE